MTPSAGFLVPRRPSYRVISGPLKSGLKTRSRGCRAFPIIRFHPRCAFPMSILPARIHLSLPFVSVTQQQQSRPSATIHYKMHNAYICDAMKNAVLSRKRRAESLTDNSAPSRGPRVVSHLLRDSVYKIIYPARVDRRQGIGTIDYLLLYGNRNCVESISAVVRSSPFCHW